MSHEGITVASEDEAALLFESAGVLDAAAHVAACWSEADREALAAAELSRAAQHTWLEATLTDDRALKVMGNEMDAEAMLRSAQSNLLTVQGETAWAVVAGRHGLHIPHGRRLEAVCREDEARVWCWDADEGVLASHPRGECPSDRPLRGRPEGVVIVRQRDGRGRLAPVRGQPPRGRARGGT